MPETALPACSSYSLSPNSPNSPPYPRPSALPPFSPPTVNPPSLPLPLEVLALLRLVLRRLRGAGPDRAAGVQLRHQITQRRQRVVVVVHRRFGPFVRGVVAVAVDLRFRQQVRTSAGHHLEP